MKTIENHSLTGGQLEQITKIERFQGVFETFQSHSRSLIKELKQSSIISSSGASTRIEGALLDDKQVQELIEKGCLINNMSSRSEREVTGYVKALNYIYDSYTDIDISEKTIREIHSLLTSELENKQLPLNQRGAYKNVPNDVVEIEEATRKVKKVWFKTTPPGLETDLAMKHLISDYQDIKLKKQCQPLIFIAGFVVHFLAIHPFRDGNGRLSRLLTNLLLLKHGYKWVQYTSHEKVIEDNKERYYVSLRTTQGSFEEESKLYNSWIDFFLKTLCTQVDFLRPKVINEISHANKEKIYNIKGISFENKKSVLNKNEQIVCDIIETQEECRFSFILENIDMSQGGLKTLLKRLVTKGFIKQKGKGRGTTYTLS